MGFEKKYKEADATWKPITTDELHQDLEGYYKDPVTVGISLIEASPRPIVHTSWASYRYVDACSCDSAGSWIDEEGEEAPCPYCGDGTIVLVEKERRCPKCSGTGQHGVQDSQHITSCEACDGDGITQDPNENLHGFHTPRGDWADRPTVDPYEDTP